jgi:exodeoxyribonuclease V alpha subunit
MSLLNTLLGGGWLRSVDHALALSLRHAREETPDWVQSAAALASRALANGHSRLPLELLPDLFAEIDSSREAPELPALADWLELLRASPWVHARASNSDDSAPSDRLLVLEGQAIALRRYHDYEVRLARALRERALEIEPRLQLLTGGPGTGKTTQVAQRLAAFVQAWDAAGAAHKPRILMAAPTGKAAARLSESVRETLAKEVGGGRIDAEFAARLPTQASTLHRLLGWQHGGFRFDAGHPLPADFVVVDEASMIDLPLMCKLAEAVPASAQLLLVGDRDQLPSVETGDVLAALCQASERDGSALAARRSHLTQSHRQAEDIDVPELAALVREGQAEAVISGLRKARFRGVHWREGNERALHEAALAQALPFYRGLKEAADVGTALKLAREFRLLCALREGPAGSQALNALIGQALDPVQGGEGLFAGRLILVTENSYRQRLFNGDIGLVWPDGAGEMRVWFEAEDGPRDWLPAALPAHEPAYALTVHKSQGSEFEQVFLALPEAGVRVLSRELLYTGLTRCRREVTLWAGEAALREAIDRRAQRWSGLSARI